MATSRCELVAEKAIPVVPAYDLLEDTKNELGIEEVTIIASALLTLLPKHQASSLWSVDGRLASLSRRL